ncbi:thioredoxin 1 [Vigna unguiculata]|uniref:Thioredoxin 1 n=1 Tax=Vigna unguiculata TaxID=3917 RepID=A0A4D6LNN6_VIGUN|nr:thioredoxin 1 [Vigna unguiculata]
MGANFSSFEFVEKSSYSSSTSSSFILTFHSTAKWNAHFHASKETNKLEVAQGFQVQTMPTFILIKKGKVVEKVVGAKKEELQKLIEKRRN